MKLSLFTRQLIVISVLLFFFIVGVLLTLVEQPTTFDIVGFIATKTIGIIFVVTSVGVTYRLFKIFEHIETL